MIADVAPPRRRILIALTVWAGVTSLLIALPSTVRAQMIPMTELLAPSDLPDIAIGANDAKVTLVEYASMTCTHCAQFHTVTLPSLKSNYINTGKLRFILREFPSDPLAMGAFMLARCVGARRDALVDMLFDRQKTWAFADEPLLSLRVLMRQTGMNDQAFDACLQDRSLYDGIVRIRDRATTKFGVAGTPSFFVNGRKAVGHMPPAEFDKLLSPFLAP